MSLTLANHRDPIKIQPHLQSHPTNVSGVWALENPWNRKKSTIWIFYQGCQKKRQGTVPDMGVMSKAIPQGSPLSISQRNLFHLPRKRKRETEEGGKTITPCIQSAALAWGVDSLVLSLWTALALTDQAGYTVWLNWNIARDKPWHEALRTLTKLYVGAVLLQNVKSSEHLNTSVDSNEWSYVGRRHWWIYVILNI